MSIEREHSKHNVRASIWVFFIPTDITTTGTWVATTWRPCGWCLSPSCPSVMAMWCLTPTAVAASAFSLGLWWDRWLICYLYSQISFRFWLQERLIVALAGGRLHGPGGGSGRQETGVDQSREACSQLHDGLPHLQEGKEQYQPQCGFILHKDVS